MLIKDDFLALAFADKEQKSRNSRLKDLEDRTSTNIYCTNVPMHWTEAVCIFWIDQFDFGTYPHRTSADTLSHIAWYRRKSVGTKRPA